MPRHNFFSFCLKKATEYFQNKLMYLMRVEGGGGGGDEMDGIAELSGIVIYIRKVEMRDLFQARKASTYFYDLLFSVDFMSFRHG